jgi:translation initiation factor 1
VPEANFNSRLVYSTDGGKVTAARTAKARGVPAPSNLLPDDGIVRIHRAKSPRGGKPMTAVSGLPGSDAELDALMRRFKGLLGSGGVRDGRTLLLQGDHRERLLAEITRLGHKAKLAGG